MRRRGKPLEVSTFPFLAVLLCAMGSLILVLIVMDRKAKLAARYKAMAAQTQAAEALAKADAARRELLQQGEAEANAARQQKRDDLHAKLVNQQQLVQAQMKEVQDQLTQAALRLKAELDETHDLKKRGDLEQARLAAEEKALATTRQALEKAGATTAADRAVQAKMTADVVQLETTLKDLKAARERDRQTFSVVPYNGKHGENRRPLYIECTRSGVVFLPDRVAVSLGGNSSAARAEVLQRLQRRKDYLESIQAKTDDKPYLMLLVRPDGITSYYELQSALRGVDLEFGYEFVDAGWTFDVAKEPDIPPAQSAGASIAKKVTPLPVGTGNSPAVAMLPPERVRPGNAVGGRESSEPASTARPRSTPSAFPPTNLQSGSPGAFMTTPQGGGDSSFHSNKMDTVFASQGPHQGQRADGAAVPSVSGPGDTTGGSGNGQSRPAGGTAAQGPGHGSESGGLPGPVLPPGVMGSAPPGRPQPTEPKGPVGPSDQQAPTSGRTAGSTASGTNGANPESPPAGRPQLGEPKGPIGPSDQQAPTFGRTAGSTASGTNGANPEKDNPPRFAPPQTAPPVKKQPPPLRVARLNGDRDYIIFLECRPDDVVLYPSQQSFSVQQLTRGDQALVQAVKHMIDRKQALVRPGELPYRPQMRFLVHPESIRSYHTAYPVLNALGVPQTRQNLEADDDVAAIVVGQ